MQDQGIGGKTDGIVQMLVPIPIINHNQGAIRQAQNEIAAADFAVQQVELDLQNRLAPVYARYASAARNVQRYRFEILPTADKALGFVRRGYQAGELAFLNVIDAQRTYFRTNLQYLETLRELRTTTAEIEGLLLRDSLGANP